MFFFARVADDLIDRGVPVDGAADGWCPVDCDDVFKVFMGCMFVLMVLGSTGRIGNVLVALRYLNPQNKFFLIDLREMELLQVDRGS